MMSKKAKKKKKMGQSHLISFGPVTNSLAIDMYHGDHERNDWQYWEENFPWAGVFDDLVLLLLTTRMERERI